MDQPTMLPPSPYRPEVQPKAPITLPSESPLEEVIHPTNDRPAARQADGPSFWRRWVLLPHYLGTQPSEGETAIPGVLLQGLPPHAHPTSEDSWRVNARVLAVASAAWNHEPIGCDGRGIGKLPLAGAVAIPSRTVEHEVFLRAGTAHHAASRVLRKEMKEWEHRARHVRAWNAKRAAERLSTATILRQAEAYQEGGVHISLYVARHGQVPIGLHPQGCDLARGLLALTQGPLADGSTLALRLADYWGALDGSSADALRRWVLEHEAVWRSIAADPLGDLRWAGGDARCGWQSGKVLGRCAQPWQALAAIFAWVDHLEQHGTLALGWEALITQGDLPARDECRHVADRLHERVLAPTEPAAHAMEAAPDWDAAPKAEDLRAYWLGHTVTAECAGVRRSTFPRSLVARQVRALPGLTATSCFDMVEAWLEEVDPTPADYGADAFRLRMARVRYLSRHLWKVLTAPGA